MTRGATQEGTMRYAEKFRGIAADGHFRQVRDLVFPSMGIGTYLGQANDSTDSSYAAAIVAAVESGINLIDTAINYRLQRSERSVGTALKVLTHKGFARDEIVVCTKGGYLTPDGSMPADPNRYFFEEYLQKGIFTAKDIAAGSHCMTPRYLENQLVRSLKNLGVDCIDIYYLHNPETQLSELSKPEFLDRIREAFEFLESAVARDTIQFYGMATWNGLRQEKSARDAMQLVELATIAKEIAGEKHHFRFLQLPFNLAMTEALTLGNQTLGATQKTIMEAADELGMTLIASASLLQGQVAQNLPTFVAEALAAC
jgi:aryl-alcohol dehydrogenase-like predicted oxidoreductase